MMVTTAAAAAAAAAAGCDYTSDVSMSIINLYSASPRIPLMR